MICLTFLGFFPSTNSSKMVARDVFLLGRRVYLIFRPSVSNIVREKKKVSCLHFSNAQICSEIGM